MNTFLAFLAGALSGCALALLLGAWGVWTLYRRGMLGFGGRGAESGGEAPSRAPAAREIEPMPEDIKNALARYPTELAEPTRRWIDDQRRLGVQWPVIEAHVLGRVARPPRIHGLEDS